jgi:hypothetical protein
VGLGLAVLIAASPAWAIFVESPTNQTESGAPPRRLTPVIRGPVKALPPQSSASPTPFRPRPLPPPRPKSTPMPGVTNMPLAAAAAILARQGLAASQVSPMASDAPPGWVVVQKPLPRTPVMAGAPIVLTVSNGPPRPAQPLPPAGFGDGVPVQPPAPTPPPVVPPTPIAPPPAAPAPSRPSPSSSAPAASAAPVASSAPSNTAASSAASPAAPPAPPAIASTAQTAGSWSPGWLAALVAALAAGAAGLGWAFRRRPPVIPSGPVLPATPVIVTASMSAPPHSEIQTVGPPPGPTIAMNWRLDPPEARLEQTPEEPSP